MPEKKASKSSGFAEWEFPFEDLGQFKQAAAFPHGSTIWSFGLHAEEDGGQSDRRSRKRADNRNRRRGLTR
jgi:hypothetical protein